MANTGNSHSPQIRNRKQMTPLTMNINFENTFPYQYQNSMSAVMMALHSNHMTLRMIRSVILFKKAMTGEFDII